MGVLIYIFGIPALFLWYVIYRLSRPISGGKTLEDWERAGELSRVPRFELGEAAFVANGWYCILDENGNSGFGGAAGEQKI